MLKGSGKIRKKPLLQDAGRGNYYFLFLRPTVGHVLGVQRQVKREGSRLNKDRTPRVGISSGTKLIAPAHRANRSLSRSGLDKAGSGGGGKREHTNRSGKMCKRGLGHVVNGNGGGRGKGFRRMVGKALSAKNVSFK